MILNVNNEASPIQNVDLSQKKRDLLRLVVFLFGWLVLWTSDFADQKVQDYLILSLQSSDKSPPNWLWMLGILLLLKDIFILSLLSQTFLWIQFPQTTFHKFALKTVQLFHDIIAMIGKAIWKLPLLIFPALIQFLQISYLPFSNWHDPEQFSPNLALRNTALRVVGLILFACALAIAFEALIGHYSEVASQATSPGFRSLLLGCCTLMMHNWFLQFGKRIKKES